MFIALRWMQRPERVMVGLTENIQACLRDFQTGTASMARKRHLASTARGFLCFCLMTLVTTGLIRSIRLIRGKRTPPSCGVLPSRQHLWWAIYIRGRCPRLLRVVPSRHRSACGVQSVVKKKLPEDGGFLFLFSSHRISLANKETGGTTCQ